MNDAVSLYRGDCIVGDISLIYMGFYGRNKGERAKMIHGIFIGIVLTIVVMFLITIFYDGGSGRV